MSLGWERYVGDEGAIVGDRPLRRERPGATIFEHFGFTADRVADVGRRVVRDGLRGRIPTLDPGHQPAGLRLGGPALGHGGDAEPG